MKVRKQMTLRRRLAYLRLFENILPNHIQVRGVFDGTNILRYSLDHHITRRKNQLMSSDLEEVKKTRNTDFRHESLRKRMRLK